MSKIELDLPEEIKDIYQEYLACLDCRDRVIKTIWSYKKAAYFGKRALKLRRTFWDKVYEVYPDYKGKSLSYVINEQILICEETENE